MVVKEDEVAHTESDISHNLRIVDLTVDVWLGGEQRQH